jgi:insertion element IS1 protein InsB
VAKKTPPRWVWHALDHRTETVVAYVFGRRKGTVLLQRKALWEPCGSTRYYTDGWGAYERPSEPEQPAGGNQHTQKIASKPINLRTRIKRLVRRPSCFSKKERRHELVIGLFMNRYECGLQI